MKCREASSNGADGVVIPGECLVYAQLTTPSARQRWLRGIRLTAHPPLVCKEGNIALQQFFHTSIDRAHSSLYREII
jgi:hypothetical protein